MRSKDVLRNVQTSLSAFLSVSLNLPVGLSLVSLELYAIVSIGIIVYCSLTYVREKL